MSKRKKTRQEKVITDLRRKLSQNDIAQKLTPPSFQAPKLAYTAIPSFQQRVLSDDYSHTYLAHDIKKTSIVTFSILVIELILFFFMKSQLLSIPVIGLYK